MADAPARALTTEANSFFSCNPDRTHLFTVNAGVPVEDALEMVSTFLSVADDLLGHAGCQSHPNAQLVFAGLYLVEFSKAIVDATIMGLPSQPEEINNDQTAEHVHA